MARIFLTKVWGFNPEIYPALGFNSEGARHKLLRESKPGDWVVLAGTRGAPTPTEQRGRLLGRVQLGTEEIDVEAVLHSIGTKIPEESYLENGRYRWPFGLPMISAERFPDLPDLAQLFGNYLSGTQWASFALDIEASLGSEARTKIDALRTEPVKIVDSPIIIRQRDRQKSLELNRSGGRTGPGPSTARSASEREPSAAFAYVLELVGGQRQIYKVGYSADFEGRITFLNKGLVSSVTGYSWRLAKIQSFPSEKLAYSFEQDIHKHLRRFLVDGEQEIYCVGRKELESAWVDIFFRGEWTSVI